MRWFCTPRPHLSGERRGALATSGKGGAFRLGCWTADSSFLALDSVPVLRPGPSSSSNSRQTHAVLPLRVTAALAGPRSSFPSYPPGPLLLNFRDAEERGDIYASRRGNVGKGEKCNRDAEERGDIYASRRGNGVKVEKCNRDAKETGISSASR